MRKQRRMLEFSRLVDFFACWESVRFVAARMKMASTKRVGMFIWKRIGDSLSLEMVELEVIFLMGLNRVLSKSKPEATHRLLICCMLNPKLTRRLNGSCPVISSYSSFRHLPYEHILRATTSDWVVTAFRSSSWKATYILFIQIPEIIASYPSQFTIPYVVLCLMKKK